MNSGIYAITNTVTNSLYVGKAQDVAARWRSHRYMLRHDKHDNIHLQRAWNKYGEGAFEFSVLEKVDVDKLDVAERFYLDVLVGQHFCYNVGLDTDSGMRGRHHTQEAREKMSKAKRGKPSPKKGIPLTEEQREKNRTSHLNPSEETRELLRQAATGNTYRRGKPHTTEAKQKNREAHIGKRASEETRRKMSEAQKARRIKEKGQN